jgi:hypothetical protein
MPQIDVLPEEPTPKALPFELIVKPTRIDNKVKLYIEVIDEHNRGVNNCRVTIIDGGEFITKRTDEDGVLFYETDLQPTEERDISVYVVGFGKEFQRLFRGRRV